MADSSLAGVIVGGLIALAAGVIGPLVIEWRRHAYEKQKQEDEKQKETRRKKEDKLEELSTALYSHEYWLIQVQNRINQGDKALDAIMTKLPPPPLPKAQAIANIYFHELKGDLTALSAASVLLIKSMLDGKYVFGQPNDESTTFVQQLRRVERLITEYAKREFQ
jgi:hypothetical protein